MKNIITKFLYSFILFLIILYVCSPSDGIFFVLFDVIWFLAFIKYSRGSNKYFWDSMLVISSAGFMALLFIKVCHGNVWYQMTLYESILVVIACLEMLVSRGIIIYQSHYSKRKQQNRINAPKLMKARRYDLERLKDYIWKHQIVGLNGAWGAGKSFLIQKLYEEEDFQKEFEVIPIDLLAVHLEEIEKILMRNLDDIMEKYGIFSGVSTKLQSLLGNYQFVDHLKSVFFQNTEIVSSAFQRFKEEVDKLPYGKKILIVFDDIDRMTDKQKIMKIFALSEKFSSNRIHILYQFGYEYLEDREFDRTELEKFIPYVVTLTDIPYEDIVSHLWEECQMGNTGMKQDDVRLFLHKDIYNDEIDKMLQKRNIHLSLTMDRLPIRSVKIFLKELETMISENSFYREEENQKILLSVLFIKNFRYQYFEQIRMGKDVVDSLLFEMESEKKTIRELIQVLNKENVEDTGAEDEQTDQKGKAEDAFVEAILASKEIYYILNLLEFDFFIEEEGGNREERANIDPQKIKRLQKNEKINHIVWNVRGNGYSEYSDMEQAVRDLRENVLTDNCSQWKDNWDRFSQKAYVLDLYKNNGGITRFGLDSYLPFFQAMRVNLTVTEEQWRRWIEFYFSQEGKNGITVEMIENLNYCDFTKGMDLYLETIQNFCKCAVLGNFNDKRCFFTFLHTFIPPISYWRFSDSFYFDEWKYKFTEWEHDTLDLLKKELESGIEALEREKNKALIGPFADELDIIMQFIQKCLEIMDAEKLVTANELQVKFSEARTVYKHQEELDRLKMILEELKGRDEKEEFIPELEDAYQKRRIFPSEYRVLCDLYHTKKE